MSHATRVTAVTASRKSAETAVEVPAYSAVEESK
jgi:hypothetical protein